MRVKPICLILAALCLGGPDLLAQANTLIIGKMANFNPMTPEVELQLNERYIDNSVTEQISRILTSDSLFAFAIEVRHPQLATLKYARNQMNIYVEPGDTLYVFCDANAFPYGTSFGGRGGLNNEAYAAYASEFPVEGDQFQYFNYRYGTLWYVNPPRMNTLMLNSGQEVFVPYLNERRDKALRLVASYDAQQPGRMSDSFRRYIEAEIRYEWGYYLLMYGNVFDTQHRLDAGFFRVLEDLPVQHEQLGSYYYREYLQAYINHRHMQSEDAGNPFVEQYLMAERYVDGEALSFVRSEIIARAFRKKEPHAGAILPHYSNFIEETPYPVYNDKAIDAYQLATKYAVGSAAPDWSLLNPNNHLIRLGDYRGRAIYLNFWASWCRPCMAKMDEMRGGQAELEAQGVVFLNISFDRSEEAWRAALAEHGFGGIHVWAPMHINSAVAKDYNVEALPQYYLIDKAGRFAEKPRKSDWEELRLALQQLNY